MELMTASKLALPVRVDGSWPGISGGNGDAVPIAEGLEFAVGSEVDVATPEEESLPPHAIANGTRNSNESAVERPTIQPSKRELLPKQPHIALRRCRSSIERAPMDRTA